MKGTISSYCCVNVIIEKNYGHGMVWYDICTFNYLILLCCCYCFCCWCR